MPDRRAFGRLRRTASRLPAVLLSGLFMFVTAGLPAVAVTGPPRELSVETKAPVSGAVSVATVHELPEAVIATTSSTPEHGLVPPASGSTVLDPRDLHLPGWWRSTGDAAIDRSTLSAQHDRAPPQAEQQ